MWMMHTRMRRRRCRNNQTEVDMCGYPRPIEEWTYDLQPNCEMNIQLRESVLLSRLLRRGPQSSHRRARSAERHCSVHVKLPSTEPFQSRLFVFTSTKRSTQPAQPEHRITRAETSNRTMAQEVQAPRQPMRGNSPVALLIGSHQQKVSIASTWTSAPTSAQDQSMQSHSTREERLRDLVLFSQFRL